MELARLGYCGATRITILRMVSEGCWAEAWVLRVCYFVAPLSPIPRWFGRAQFLGCSETRKYRSFNATITYWLMAWSLAHEYTFGPLSGFHMAAVEKDRIPALYLLKSA
jgi:hypothetical protein